MVNRKAVFPFLIAFLAATIQAQEGPHRPSAKPVSLESQTTAVLVLDLSTRCDNPKQVCSKLMPAVGNFLEKARAVAVPIIFTVSAAAKGTPLGEVAAPLKRREGEPVIYPDGFDKFVGGELLQFLKQKGTKSLVIIGASTNVAVLYTATTAARIHQYNVIIPMDGVIADSNYEQEYSFHQLTVIPSQASKLFQFTDLKMISLR